MKLSKSFLIVMGSILFLFSSCQQGDQQEETSSPTTEELESSDPEETGGEGLPYLIQYNTENDHFELKENQDGHLISEQEIVQALNTKYPEIKTEVVKQSNDTLFVSIPDATYLTQSTGTAGATSYLIEATYGFTSITGIKVVDFFFEEGDHAVPGPYTRDSFNDFFR